MAMLLDIEGTTTSISFVYDVLFPYARAHVEPYLEARWETPEVAGDVAALRAQAEADRAAGLAVPPIAPDGADRNDVLTSVVANVLAQMDTDRKTTALKSLQGHIWRDGYAAGALRGHVYCDVPVALSRWHDRGERTFIYSSGSVEAQKLLFGASEAGNLLPLIAGHFDTRVGPKGDPGSYRAIAAETGLPTGDLTFVTDVLAEARAASDAGANVVVSVRPGNPVLPPHPFREIRSFDELD